MGSKYMKYAFITATPPVFVNLPHTVDVYEDIPVGTEVFRVNVNDKEVDAGSETLVYQMAHTHFSIDPATGENI